MKNNFTTPPFAKVLKEHGIEIDTQFYWENNGNGLRLMAFACDSPYIICIGEFDPTLYGSFVCEPTYPLTEVLGWLPETIICEGKLHQIDFDTVNLTVGYARAKLLEMVWAIEPKNISDIIIQGLTEKWLTKETILQAIKDNAK
jgi:hypothetical protein